MPRQSTGSADLVLRNGAIYTMDAARPWVEALAIRDGRLLALGPEAQVRAAAAPDARVVDLHGRMAMPGIVDVHSHFVWAGRAELYETTFPPILTLEQVLDQVRQTAAKQPPGAWVVGGIWGSGLIGELTAQARLALDEAAGGRPVMLRDDSHHNRWASTAALQQAGIDASTPNPRNGEIVRDASGEATGLLLESASALVEAAVAKALAASPQLDFNAAAHAIRRFNACGVTATQEALTTRAVLEAIKSLEGAGQLTAWVVGSLPVVEAPLAPGEWGETLFALRDHYRSRHFRPDAGKIFLDGVPTSRTAAMLEPYLPDAAHGCCFRGGTTLTVPQLARALADCEARGIAVKIHCAGDGAVRSALDAVEVLRSFNGPGLAHQIAHASFIADDDVPRFAALNVVADLSPMLWFPGVIVEAIRAAVPSERVERFWPNRDLMEAGALIAAGSDWPVVHDPSPWAGIQGMVTRRDPTGRFPGALWPEQALDLASVLRAYTINPARAMGLADETGSLEVGKSADLIVLDRHLFEVPPEELAATRVLSTYFEGRVVHEAGS
ncbi:amidohydrolase [Ramlibacter sp. WS9]|uniref:amidohydrolase n=1 Tax=Ramlibacter sp. WS9 TaxID=1882741 RepID=UPI0011431867|nr:amidohydrolase [Ramlibacter sp. WS9]ROZ78092.1 amidohydrolase [Ramlibacter sp. WS9]HSV36680.1 amidohydrolase [Ramlibacter sp.]